MKRACNECVLCREFNGELTDTNFRRYCGSQHSTRVVHESANWTAAPSLGALALGHLLICPKVHYLSIAAALREPSLLSEFRHVITNCMHLLEEQLQLGPVLMFEHGTVRAGAPIGCGTDHAHLHLVPCAEDLTAEIHEELSGWTSIDGWPELARCGPEDNYLLFVSQNGQFHLATGVNPNVRQFFRRILARKAGLQDFEWRSAPRPDLVHAFLKMVRHCSSPTIADALLA